MKQFTLYPKSICDPLWLLLSWTDLPQQKQQPADTHLGDGFVCFGILAEAGRQAPARFTTVHRSSDGEHKSKHASKPGTECLLKPERSSQVAFITYTSTGQARSNVSPALHMQLCFNSKYIRVHFRTLHSNSRAIFNSRM